MEAGQELLPCGNFLAVTVPGQGFRGFFKTISGNELEKLLKDAIVMRRRASFARMKDFRYLRYNAEAYIINQVRQF